MEQVETRELSPDRRKLPSCNTELSPSRLVQGSMHPRFKSSKPIIETDFHELATKIWINVTKMANLARLERRLCLALSNHFLEFLTQPLDCYSERTRRILMIHLALLKLKTASDHMHAA